MSLSAKQTAIVTGTTGTGKATTSHAPSPVKACRKGFRGLYRRVARLFDELRIARTGTTTASCLSDRKADVLVLDDCALRHPLPRRRAGIYSRSSRRPLRPSRDRLHGTRSDPTDGTRTWPTPPSTDAILRSCAPGAHEIALTGPSRRKTQERIEVKLELQQVAGRLPCSRAWNRHRGLRRRR
ncbi:MAG: ATP-binding protein, partial [Myxococcales bacterium]|nr:ATP-binding protein [Myxococcales bacterium]